MYGVMYGQRGRRGTKKHPHNAGHEERDSVKVMDWDRIEEMYEPYRCRDVYLGRGGDEPGTKKHAGNAGHGERDSAEVMHWVRRARDYGRTGV